MMTVVFTTRLELTTDRYFPFLFPEDSSPDDETHTGGEGEERGGEGEGGGEGEEGGEEERNP